MHVLCKKKCNMKSHGPCGLDALLKNKMSKKKVDEMEVTGPWDRQHGHHK
jgi:predicted nucleic acid-binding Zn ribbon protein